jgi:chromosome segregation ATPase
MGEVLGSLFGTITPGPRNKASYSQDFGELPWEQPQKHSPDESGLQRLVELFTEQLAKRDAELEQVTARLNQYVAALAERDDQIRSLVDEVSRQRPRMARLEAENAELRATRAEALSRVAQQANELNQARATFGGYNDLIAGQRRQLAQQADELEEYRRALAERDEQILSLKDEVSRQTTRGNRFQTKGRQLLAEVAELRRHADAIRKFAGGRNAMFKAMHPDTAPPEDRAARTEIFKLVQFIFEGRR